MLYWLTEFSAGGDFFNLFRYITFRAGMAFATAQVGAPGVWIAMSGQVFDGLKVKKDRAAGKFVALD